MAKKDKTAPPALIRTWTLPPAATLGSSVRAHGLLLEIRARLPLASRKSLDTLGMDLVLGMPEDGQEDFDAISHIVSKTLEGIEALPVIPREIQDILTITATERRRWLEDGRLPSAGIRTVRLRGRAKQITFHVFDPAVVLDLLDRGIIDEWREDDAARAAENRRKAAWKAKATRSLKKRETEDRTPDRQADKAGLAGWEDFDRDGFLR